MGTSFIQMAYNMIDMIWIGRLGSSGVASVGTAGFYLWMAVGFIILSKIGAQINVAQSFGRNDIGAVKRYSGAGLQGAVITGLAYCLSVYIFKTELIDFFKIDDAIVNSDAVEYLQLVVFGLFFMFINEVVSGIIIGSGESSFPFKVNAAGLITNIIMDPILIFGMGPFSQMGVRGAAVATVMSQIVVTICYGVFIVKDENHFLRFPFFSRFYYKEIKENVRIGLPVSIQSILFTFFSMYIARIVAVWGPVAVAIQRVGGQIESVSWRTAEGFSSALSSFIGQNYGAGDRKRVEKGFMVAFRLMTIFGIFTSVLLIVFAKQIITVFIPEIEAIIIGTDYLKILGFSQLFMCIEITSHGAFAGMGKTKPPAVISIVFNCARIPLALVLSKTVLDLNGVWWSICITSIIKGVILPIWFVIVLKKYVNNKIDLEV
jgi:putative MATE family efflux protein